MQNSDIITITVTREQGLVLLNGINTLNQQNGTSIQQSAEFIGLFQVIQGKVNTNVVPISSDTHIEDISAAKAVNKEAK